MQKNRKSKIAKTLNLKKLIIFPSQCIASDGIIAS